MSKEDIFYIVQSYILEKIPDLNIELINNELDFNHLSLLKIDKDSLLREFVDIFNISFNVNRLDEICCMGDVIEYIYSHL